MIIVEAKPAVAQLFSEHATFLTQVVDRELLLLVHPSGHRDQHKPERVENLVHLQTTLCQPSQHVRVLGRYDVMKHGTPKLFTPADIEALSPKAAEYLLGEGLRAFISLPLISRGRVFGTLNLGARKEDVFASDDVALLWQAAGQIAIAVDNALSYRRIEQLNARLAEEKVYLEDEIRTDHQFEEIIGQSKTLKVI